MHHKPRAEKYHIINRGVNIFKEPSDYAQFEKVMCVNAKSFGITIHNYCLLDNHYHLLIEITTKNLSKFMRELNMNYTRYYNKKYKSVGELWQGRFKSWYVTEDTCFYTLMCHIEQKPLEANSIKDLTAYPYSSYHYFIDNKEVPECLKDSWIVQTYKNDKEAVKLFLTKPIENSQLQELKNASLLEVTNTDKSQKLGKKLTIALSVLFALLLLVVYSQVTKEKTSITVNSENEQKNSSIEKTVSTLTAEKPSEKAIVEKKEFVKKEQIVLEEDVIDEDVAYKSQEELDDEEDMDKDDAAYKSQEELDDEKEEELL